MSGTAATRTTARAGGTGHRDVRAVLGTLLGAVLTALMVVSTVPVASAAVVSATGEQTLVVEGDVVTIVVDPAPGEDEAATAVKRRVDVDGRLYVVPGLEEAGPADRVRVTLAADPALTVTEALVEAGAGGPRARVLDIAVVVEPAVDGARRAQLSTGAHTLLVLPVYWSGQDASTRTSLQQAAGRTASYWQRQSSGRLTLSTTVRDWKPIANPGTCARGDFEEGIFSAALAAHGVSPSAVSLVDHVAVYFPDTVGCGYDGQAEVGGGRIWLNGSGGATGGAPDAEHTHYVLAHELGHNLGLGHANTLVCYQGSAIVTFSEDCDAYEYGDNTDVMGMGNLPTPGNLSAAFADQLGYARTQTVTGATVSASTVTLAPTASVGSLRAVKFPGEDRTFYVEYRPAVAPDVHEPSWAGVQVRVVVWDDWGIPETYLLDLQPQTPGTRLNLPIGAPWAVPDASTTVTVKSTSASGAAIELSPAGATSRIQRYIRKVYRDLFHRDVDPSGLTTWTTKLASGTPRVAVANSITYSNEYRSRLITASYQHFLGRSPEPAGLQHWLRMMSTGYTIQRMEAGFLASPEYYAKAGSTPQGWVRELYRHVLGRGAGASEVAHWTDVLARGGSRNTVAMGFLLSNEHLTTVVDGYYRDLLGRGIDPSGRTTWVSKIQAGHRVEEIIGGIIASEEYYAKS